MDTPHVLVYMAGAAAVGAIVADRLRRRQREHIRLLDAATPRGPSTAALVQAALNDHPATRRSPQRIQESVEQNVMRNTLHQAHLKALNDIALPLWAEELTIPTTVPVVVDDRVPVFKGDEPRTLDTYIGQQTICHQLDLSIRALGPDQFVLKHKLLTGLPGFGKTLLAKIISHTLDTRAREDGQRVQFVETYAANLNSVEALDTLVRSIDPEAWTVWFIDEIHVLNKELATKLYLLMEDGRYPFEGDLTPTALPRVMLLGATTDYGALHPALKRRFGEGLMLQPLSRSDLLRMAGTLGYPITDDAAALLVSRCVHGGAPHELKTLFGECVIVAKATQQSTIVPATVEQVFTTFGVDPLGLRPIDRTIITALRARPRFRGRTGELIGYGGSENDVCMSAGLDKGEFRDVIRPRLLTRGLIEVRAGIGLCLTDRALRHYPA